jgi:hypothetical protein
VGLAKFGYGSQKKVEFFRRKKYVGTLEPIFYIWRPQKNISSKFCDFSPFFFPKDPFLIICTSLCLVTSQRGKKVEIFNEEHVGTYCLNMATSKKRFLLMWRLRPIFSKKFPLYHLHRHFLVTSDQKKKK